MRIVGGAWRGRALVAPDGPHTRPSSERLREGLFNVLAHAPWAAPFRVDGRSVLDAFAGTGALGLEALSRGAAQAVFMENASRPLEALRQNVARCGAAPRCRILRADALHPPPADRTVAVALLDPPYGVHESARVLSGLAGAGWIDGSTLVVIETARDAAAPELGTVLDARRYGAAMLFFGRI